MPRVSKPRTAPPASVAYFMAHLYTRPMRQYIVDLAKSMVHGRENQEDLVQEGWLRLGKMPEGLSEACYRREAYRAMKRIAVRDYRGRVNDAKVFEAMAERILMDEPVYGRPTPKAQECIRYRLKKNGANGTRNPSKL